MIQRKQNYILILILILDLVFMIANMPIYTGKSLVKGVEQVYSVNAFYCHVGEERFMNLYLFIACNALALFIASTVRSYKNLQHQLIGVKAIFVVLLLMTFLIYFPQGKIMERLGEVKETHLNKMTALIFLIYILNFLAYRGIKKDIELLASADRLR